MRKILTVIVLLVFAGMASAAEAKPFKLAFRDYKMDDQELRPISFGICTWTDSETSCDVAGYFDIALVSMLSDRLRLGVGIMGKPDDFYLLNVKMETSVTVRLDWLEVGVYYCPFWGLASEKFGDDPAYGIMVGYAFKL